MIAVGSGIAVGMNTMLSHGLGEKQQQKVNDSASAAIWLILLFGVLSILASVFLVEPYMAVQTTDTEIRAAGVQYLQIYFFLGAAAATVFSQSVATAIAIFLNIRKNREVQILLRPKPPFAAIRQLLVLGAPTALVMSLNSFMMINFNAVLN